MRFNHRRRLSISSRHLFTGCSTVWMTTECREIHIWMATTQWPPHEYIQLDFAQHLLPTCLVVSRLTAVCASVFLYTVVSVPWQNLPSELLSTTTASILRDSVKKFMCLLKKVCVFYFLAPNRIHKGRCAVLHGGRSIPVVAQTVANVAYSYSYCVTTNNYRHIPQVFSIYTRHWVCHVFSSSTRCIHFFPVRDVRVHVITTIYTQGVLI